MLQQRLDAACCLLPPPPLFLPLPPQGQPLWRALPGRREPQPLRGPLCQGKCWDTRQALPWRGLECAALSRCCMHHIAACCLRLLWKHCLSPNTPLPLFPACCCALPICPPPSPRAAGEGARAPERLVLCGAGQEVQPVDGGRGGCAAGAGLGSGLGGAPGSAPLCCCGGAVQCHISRDRG